MVSEEAQTCTKPATRRRARLTIRQSADAELVYLFQRRPALAADHREAVAAGQRILHFLLTLGAIQFSTQSLSGRRGFIPCHGRHAGDGDAADAFATIAARACRKISYWLITSRNTASPSIRYPGPVKCTWSAWAMPAATQVSMDPLPPILACVSQNAHPFARAACLCASAITSIFSMVCQPTLRIFCVRSAGPTTRMVAVGASARSF